MANLLIALTKLADVVSPMTAESLRECTKRDIRHHPYWYPAIFLCVLIVVYSTVSFVTSSIATSIRNDITIANALAVKFTVELETPTADSKKDGKSSSVTRTGPSSSSNFSSDPAASLAMPSITTLPHNLKKIDVASDLQKFAATVRDIDAHTRQLSRFTNLYSVVFKPHTIDPFSEIRQDPDQLHQKFDLQLPVTDYAKAAADRMRVYHQVRYLAQNVIGDVAFYYAALSSCILPVMYALLGAAAFFLRSFERRVSTRTYTASAADSTRFLVAAIGGTVVGLFSNFAGNVEFKVSPLALAFLVGYAVDMFYAFLENLIQSLTKTVLPSGTERKVSTTTARPALPETGM